MNRIDAKQLRYTELFLVEGKKIESGPNCGTEYKLVGQLENGDLIYIDQVPTEGAVTREEYYAISKQEYRDLLEKALNKGLSVTFSNENGFSVIRICKGSEVVASCSLGSGDFRTNVEDSLQSLMMDLDRKGI